MALAERVDNETIDTVGRQVDRFVSLGLHMGNEATFRTSLTLPEYFEKPESYKGFLDRLLVHPGLIPFELLAVSEISMPNLSSRHFSPDFLTRATPHLFWTHDGNRHNGVTVAAAARQFVVGEAHSPISSILVAHAVNPEDFKATAFVSGLTTFGESYHPYIRKGELFVLPEETRLRSYTIFTQGEQTIPLGV